MSALPALALCVPRFSLGAPAGLALGLVSDVLTAQGGDFPHVPGTHAHHDAVVSDAIHDRVRVGSAAQPLVPLREGVLRTEDVRAAVVPPPNICFMMVQTT